MILVSLTLPPKPLVGVLTRYLLKLPNNLLIGDPDAKIRKKIIQEISEGINKGSAIIVWNDDSPEGYQIITHGNHEIIEFDGYQTINTQTKPNISSHPQGWSNASKYLKAKKYRYKK